MPCCFMPCHVYPCCPKPCCAEGCALLCAEDDTGYGRGSITGYSDPGPYKVWDVLNGLGDFAFAYSFSYILLEITVSLLPCL